MGKIKNYSQIMRVDTEATRTAMTPSDGAIVWVYETHRGYAYKNTGDPGTSGWTRITDKTQLDALQALLQASIDAKEPLLTAGTTAQYLRGDKSWQTLNKSAVGLANVDNTSDATKPVSTAQQAAIDKKTAVYIYDAGVKITAGTPQTGDSVIWHDTITSASGNATFYVTSDRTNAGTAICSSLSANSVDVVVIDSAGVYSRGTATITGNKQITVPVTKETFGGVTLLGIDVLGTRTMPATPNGVTVKLYVIGVKA